jgi:hypothetical protein
MKEAENEYEKLQRLKETLAATTEAMKEKKAKCKGLKVDFSLIKKRNAELANTVARQDEELKALRMANAKLEMLFKDSVKAMAQIQSRFEEQTVHAKELEEEVMQLTTRAAVNFDDLTPRFPDLPDVVSEFGLLKGKQNQKQKQKQSTAEVIEELAVALRQARSRVCKHKSRKKGHKSACVVPAPDSQNTGSL